MEAKKFMFFQAGSNDAACYPVEALRGFDTSAGKVHFYFQSQRLTSVVTGDNNDLITVSCGADEKATIKAVVEAIAATGSMKDPFINIADEVNGVYLTGSGITACDSINYAA